MTRTRRDFLRTGAIALAGSCLSHEKMAEAVRAGEPANIKCLDYLDSATLGSKSRG